MSESHEIIGDSDIFDLRKDNEPCESIYAHIWRLFANVRSSQSVILIVCVEGISQAEMLV